MRCNGNNVFDGNEQVWHYNSRKRLSSDVHYFIHKTNWVLFKLINVGFNAPTKRYFVRVCIFLFIALKHL
jgi:hypothetical protein